MKPITLKQWNKLDTYQKSWLVNKCLGRRPSIFWIFSQDGTKTNRIPNTGTPDSLDYVKSLIKHARKKDPSHPIAKAIPRRIIAFPLWAANDHSAYELAEKLAPGFSIVMSYIDGAWVVRATKSVRLLVDPIDVTLCCVEDKSLAVAMTTVFMRCLRKVINS